MQARSRRKAISIDRENGHGAQVLEMQRRRLLLAIGEILAGEGLDGATVGRICKHAGVSRRTFYEMFDDREACLLAAFQQAIDHIAQRVVPVYTDQGRWRDRVRRALVALLECFEEQPILARLCIIEAPRAGPVVMELRRKALDALNVVVAEGCGEAKSSTGSLPLIAESTVGGALAVVHARLLEDSGMSLTDLAGPLTSMIVYPYLGASAARIELERPVPVPRSDSRPAASARDLFRDLPIRITMRTARVLSAIAEQPCASNRQVGDIAEVSDQGQMSKLLRRLERAGLIENRGEGHPRGEPNAWVLTGRGDALQAMLLGRPPG